MEAAAEAEAEAERVATADAAQAAVNAGIGLPEANARISDINLWIHEFQKKYFLEEDILRICVGLTSEQANSVLYRSKEWSKNHPSISKAARDMCVDYIFGSEDHRYPERPPMEFTGVAGASAAAAADA